MLHVHPTGTATAQTVAAILGRLNPLLDVSALVKAPLNGEERRWLGALGARVRYGSLSRKQKKHLIENYFLLPAGRTHSFTRFEAVFAFLGILRRSRDMEYRLFRDFVARMKQHGVFYVEFTSRMKSPRRMAFYGEVVRRLQREFSVVIRFNAAFARTRPEPVLRKRLLALIARRIPSYIVGIDLYGDEGGHPALEKGQWVYGPALRATRRGELDLKRTMHAGEFGDKRNPRDALIMGVNRLGHGVRLNEDPVALEYAARNRIGIEINFTSNLTLGMVPELRRHPFLDYLRLGVPVSLSTDDEGIFRTDMTRECVLAVTRSDIQYAELKQIMFNSLLTAFVSDNKKQQLIKRLEGAFADFEKTCAPRARPGRQRF